MPDSYPVEELRQSEPFDAIQPTSGTVQKQKERKLPSGIQRPGLLQRLIKRDEK